jgi:hypothetical protein
LKIHLELWQLETPKDTHFSHFPEKYPKILKKKFALKLQQEKADRNWVSGFGTIQYASNTICVG